MEIGNWKLGGSSPILSVLLPVYNAAPTLSQAIRSLVRQTLREIEILAVDDGSEDGSPELLREWAGRDHRIKPLLHTHQGLIETLNAGLHVASGAFVARMDADDISHPRRLELQVGLFREDPSLNVVGCLVRSFPRRHVRRGFRIYEEWLNRLTAHEEIAREIFIESPLPHPSVMVRREELVDLGGYRDRGWPEDYDLWLRYHLAGKRFAKVERVLLLWRESEARLTRRDPRYSVENFLRAKAHYLAGGPLSGRSAIVWGAGKTGRRLSKHLLREDVEIMAFVDIDPAKIGRTLRGKEILSPDDLPERIQGPDVPLVLSAVSSRGARKLIRERLTELGLEEGTDFLCVA